MHYWRGIEDALRAQGAVVVAASVPPSASIEDRAAKLAADIAAKVAPGQAVNVVAHSMGGLDARYMVSRLRPRKVKVKSLVTIATPHHGSAYADHVLGGGGVVDLRRLYGVIERAGFGTGAFAQLTRRYMEEDFNPRTPDVEGVRYFSYGAAMAGPPALLNPFRASFRVLEREEGPNDGLVSVKSSQWGTYKGTLVGVSHLDLINWSNWLMWTARRLTGRDRT